MALILVVAALLPGYQRSRAATALAEAQHSEEIDDAARAYLQRIQFNSSFIDGFVRGEYDAPLSTRLHLVRLAHFLSDGAVARLQVLASLVRDAQWSDQERADILNLMAEIYNASQHGSVHMPSTLTAWAAPEERPDEGRRALAKAAIAMLTHLDDRSDVLVAQTFADIARDAAADSLLVQAAVVGLAEILRPATVNHAINVLNGPNADAASQHQPLLDAVYRNVRAAHIPALLRLWDSSVDAVAGLGYRAIAGPGVTLGDDDAATREELGQRVSALLTHDMLQRSPVRFQGLVDATRNLRLTGTREQLLSLAPHMDEEVTSQVAGVLATFVRAGDDHQRSINEDVVRRLTRAVRHQQSRSLAAQALAEIRANPSPGQIMSLREAVQTLAEHGEDEQAMAALHHIVGEHYSRKDLIDRFGDDAQQWHTYLSEDLPRFEFFREVQEWYEANREKITVRDRDSIEPNRERLREVRPRIISWIEADPPVVPLGLSRRQIEDLNAALGRFNRGLVGAHSFSGD
ncbi:MAG: hypothetical protein EA401_02235 [Planctomycetota bacterium]|nr:MAG: hypothetical protein EA401_02235 [Planctomycetota bacterium]